MNLCEWASNSSEFLQNIPECDWSSVETMKVLWISWNLTTDTIFINGSHNLSSEVTTKRDALQTVSRIYDPLGLFSPATLNAKLWKRLGWYIQSVTSTRMEQNIWEPDSIVLSAITQIYWRWTQTALLHRCLCQSLFSSSIPLFFSKQKNNCHPGICQSMRRTGQTQHSKLGAARCSYWNEMLQLCNSTTSVVLGG